MPERKRININDVPKWFKIFYIVAPVLGFLLIDTHLDNDFYFIYKTGEHIVNNGFPTTDFLSMHSTMHIIVQQWLSSVIYYFLYSRLGQVGVIGFVFICYTLFCIVMHKLTKLITHNLFVASAFSFFADLLAAAMFETSRPQAITMLLIMVELYLLESFVQKGKIIYLCFLPLVSLALINLHAAMWAMMFVFAAPYGVAAIPFKFKKTKQEPCCSFVKLFVCGVVCFIVGFINPYGLKAMTYITTSFGYSAISENVVEMQSPSITDAWGVVLFGFLAVFACIAIFKKEKAFTTRFVLLFAGTTLMALLNTKSIAYFIVGAIPAFSYFMKDAELMLVVDEGNTSNKDRKKRVTLILLIVVMLGVLGVVLTMKPSVDDTAVAENKTASSEESDYTALREMVKILDRENRDDVVLFAGFNHGQFFEFYDYHPYVDGRAELFLKDNNGEFDYLQEYIDVRNGTLYYKDFVDKYRFTYLATDSTDMFLQTSLLHDDDYEIAYKSGKNILFRLKD